jgi:hypothetical protein
MQKRNHFDRERMEELCSLVVLGEISPEERLILNQHLKACGECRALLEDFERIANFDLSATAAYRMENQYLPEIDAEVEDRLLASVMAQAARQMEDMVADEPANSGSSNATTIVPACPVPFRSRLAKLQWVTYPVGGALAAALVLLAWLYLIKPSNPVAPPVSQVAVPYDPSTQEELTRWRSRALQAESQNEAAKRDLTLAQARAQASAAALTQATEQYQKLLASEGALEARITQQDDQLRQQSASLTAERTSLEEERAEGATLRAQLQEVTARAEKQKAEVAHLQEVAASTVSRFPVPDQQLLGGDAREIFGARDLHIVDVYDVDHAGVASRTYGRVYYVNHHLLLFYAFDLGNSAKNRKPVAFQAWGFRQPNSTTAESLGLFYLDDPKLDRWALRVSDPHLLARIDTLFVTVEPPGGSNFPKGRQLLLASLVGPPNHP